MIAEKLRKSILQAAIEGKLTEQRPEDGDARDLVTEIKIEKKELIKAGKIKKEKTLPEITADEIPFDIPNNWCWVRLGDYIKLKSGIDLKPDKYNDKTKGIPYITGASNIENGNVLINRWTEYPTRITEPMDILLTCKGTVGKLAITNTEAHIARQIMSIRPFKKLEREYLLLLLEYNTDNLQKNSLGIIPGIRREDVLNMLLPFPPHNEQLRIIDIYKKYSSIVDSIEASEMKLEKIDNSFEEKLKSSILQTAMQGKLTDQLPEDGDAHDLLEEIQAEKQCLIEEGRLKKQKLLPPITEEEIPFDIPDNWIWVRLGDCTDMYTGDSIPKLKKKLEYEGLDEGYPYIATKDVWFDGTVDYNNGVRIPFDEPKFRIAEAGTPLLCIEGGSAGRKIGLLNQDVCFGNKLCNFNPIGYNEKFLYYYLQSSSFLSNFKEGMTGIIGGISLKNLKNIIIPLSPTDEQKRIVSKLEKLLS